ncbi:MAG: DNA recombination/repair protein RecA, partial [Deinococcales bacterium]|nr:DNA recombination/repair protein RecA [Deinococcales bacterium]
KSGSWFSFGDTRLGQGKEKAAEAVAADPQLMARVRELVLAQLSGAPAPSRADDEVEEVAE